MDTTGGQEYRQESSIEDDIRALEEKLAQKKQEAMERGVEREGKEMVREALKERIEDVRGGLPDRVPDVRSEIPSIRRGAQEESLARHEEDVRQLVELALTKSITKAVHTAEKNGKGYLVDELHDRLVEPENYEKLLQLGKIDSF